MFIRPVLVKSVIDHGRGGVSSGVGGIFVDVVDVVELGGEVWVGATNAFPMASVVSARRTVSSVGSRIWVARKSPHLALRGV